MTGPMTVVSFVFRCTPRWAAFSRVSWQKNPRCWGASWPLTLAPRDALPSAPRPRSAAGTCRGSPYAPAGSTGCPAGTGIRPKAEPAGSLARPPATACALAAAAAAGVPPGGLACFLLRFPCLFPGLAGLGLRRTGRVAALLLQLRRGEDLARGGQLRRPPAQQVPGRVVVEPGRAAPPPHRLLRRGDIDPGPLAQRAAQRLEHPLRAARRPF